MDRPAACWPATRRVIGVDPGTRVSGWAVIEPAGHPADGYLAVAWGTLRLPVERPIAERLTALHRGLLALIDEHAPGAVVIEEAFVGHNARSTIRLGEARGVCLLAAHLRGLEVFEMPPALVKRSVAGHGGAGKEAVRAAVLRALRIDPAASGLPAFDASDALALALAALGRLESIPVALGGAPIGRRGRRRRWSSADLDRLGGAG